MCVCTSILVQHEGRKYCAHDFHALFAPCCSGCGKCSVNGYTVFVHTRGRKIGCKVMVVYMFHSLQVNLLWGE